MKQLILLLSICVWSTGVMAQHYTAKIELDEPIEGICNADSVYYLLNNFNGQLSANCEVSEQEINMRLKTEVPYVKKNPKFKAEGTISLFINCEGDLVKVKPITSKSDEFNAQMMALFETLTKWKPAKFYKDAVDSQFIYRFVVKKGKIELS